MSQRKAGSSFCKTLLSLFLVAAFFVGVAVIPDTEIFTAYADKVDDLKEKKKDIQKKISENEKKLKELQSSISDQKDVLDSLNVIIEEYESKISVLNTSIDEHNKEIDTLNLKISEINGEIARIDEEIHDINNSIEQKENDIEGTLDLLKERMRSQYIAGGVSDIEILIGSSDFASFLTRLEILDRAADYDDKLIGEFEDDIDELGVLIEECEEKKAKQDEKKSEVEAKKLDVQASKDAVQADIDELDVSKSEVESRYGEAVEIARQLDEKSDTYKKTIELLERDEDRVADEIASFLRQNGSSSSEEKKYYYTGDSKWAFPLAVRSYYVSSNYGWRSFGGGEFHKGIDICSKASDKTVVATRGGKVINQGYHYSMGNYVMIDHGDGYTSIYMHFRDSAYVHTGETVKQGQAIGYMGTTGNSTGVHLHFQINKDGSHVNPNNYINF